MKKELLSGHSLILVLAGLGSFIGAVQLAPGHEGPEVIEATDAVSTRPQQAKPANPETAGSIDAAAPATPRLTTDAPQADLFGPRSWLPPPPPPLVSVVAPAPPPAPTAPPLPFSFIGQIDNGGGAPKAFLSHSEALHIVAAGDLVEKVYRVESITPTQVVLTYLPMMQAQFINLTGPAR